MNTVADTTCTISSTRLSYLAPASSATRPASAKVSARSRSSGLNCSSLSGRATCQVGSARSR